MPIVQVEVHVLAEPTERARDVEHMRQGASHRVLDVRHQVRQAVVHRAKLLEVKARMAVSEPGGRLPQADVANIDAVTHPLSALEPLRHLDEPAAIQSGGVLEKNEGTARLLAKPGIQLAHPGNQAVRLCPHLTFVVDDQAGDASREAIGELPHHRAVPPVQHVDATVQVDDGQTRMGGRELQDILELVGCVGVYLGGRAHLGEAQPSELEQRIVPIYAPLEQGVNAVGHHLPGCCSPGTIHNPDSRSVADGLLLACLYPRMSQTQARTALGRPWQLLHPWGKAVDSARYCPPQPLQLRTGAVMTHSDVVDNPLYLFLPMLKFALSATALVHLMVAVPPTGERPPMGGSRFQIGCLPDP